MSGWSGIESSVVASDKNMLCTFVTFYTPIVLLAGVLLFLSQQKLCTFALVFFLILGSDCVSNRTNGGGYRCLDINLVPSLCTTLTWSSHRVFAIKSPNSGVRGTLTLVTDIAF